MKALFILIFTLLLALPLFAQNYVPNSDRSSDGVFNNFPRQTPKWFVQTEHIKVLHHDSNLLVARLLDKDGEKIKDIVLDDYVSVHENGAYLYLAKEKYRSGVINTERSAFTRLQRDSDGTLVLTFGVSRGAVIGYTDTANKNFVEK